jgi:hypothetical protein
VGSAPAEALLRLHGSLHGLGAVGQRLCHAGLEAARAALAGVGGVIGGGALGGGALGGGSLRGAAA